MKKIISILLAGILCMSSFVGVFAEQDKALPDNFITIVNTLQSLGIIGEADITVENYNRTVSRGEFVSGLLKLIRMDVGGNDSSFYDLPKGHTYYASVGTAFGIELLDAENGKIRPDDPITYGEAVKAVTVLIGADADINDFAYYSGLARNKGILRSNASENATVSFGKMTEILYNALQAEALNVLSPDGNRYKGASLLESCWGLKIGTGLVTANGHYSLSGAVKLASNQLMINGRAYSVEDYVDIDCVGLRVRYFYDDNGKIAVIEKEKHDKAIISSKDMIGLSEGSCRYYNESGNEKSKRIGSDAYVLVNYDYTLSKDIDIPLNGEVVLMDYDCDDVYDVVLVNNYIEIVANYIDKEFEIISGKGGKTVNYESEHILVYADGGRGTVEDIVPGSTLSVCCGADEIADVIYVSNEVTEGRVTEISEEYVNIRGKRYELSPGMDSRISIKVGDSGTFYINRNGEIAYYISGSTRMQFGYLMGVGAEGVISQEASIRVLTQSNEKVVYPLKKKITYNGVRRDAVDVVAELQPSGFEGSCEQVIRFDVDKDGAVNKLETAAPNDTGITPQSDRLYLAAEKNGINGVFDGVTALGRETVEFIVPEAPRGDDELYRAGAAAERNSNRTFKAYNLRKYQYAASVIVHYADVSADLNYDELPAMVSEVVTTLNENGEVRKQVTLLQSTGWPSTIKEFTYFVSEKPLWETVNGSVENTPQHGDNLNVGDMILYALNELNEIVRINRVYNGETKSIDSAYGNVTEVTNAGRFDSGFRLRVSYPFMSEDKFLIASKVPITSLNPPQEDLEYYEHHFDDVLIVEKSRQGITMRKGTMADIRTYENYGDACDKVILQTRWSWLYNVVAFRCDV